VQPVRVPVDGVELNQADSKQPGRFWDGEWSSTNVRCWQGAGSRCRGSVAMGLSCESESDRKWLVMDNVKLYLTFRCLDEEVKKCRSEEVKK